MTVSIHQAVLDCIKKIADFNSAELLLYSADIDDKNADKFISDIRKNVENRRDNVVLILATYGGDPDAAYRITRFLQKTYKKFTLFVFGYCKSAGTLIALGADEIVMSDLAELGPLDVQVLKENDFRRSSGLDLQKAIEVLSEQAYFIFESYFLATVYKSGGVVTTQMAAEIASSMAVNLLAPIASQIDPLKLGELSRSMEVAYEYGMRLNESLESTVKHLVSGYPSHSFVIDRQEASRLFRSVREPTEDELALEAILFEAVRSPTSEKTIINLNDFFEELDVNEFQSNDDNLDEDCTQENDGDRKDEAE